MSLAILSPALTPTEGTQQASAARAAALGVGIAVPWWSQRALRPRPGRCPADSGLPHCREESSESARRWGARDGVGAGTQGARRAGVALTRRQGGPVWPGCGPFPGSFPGSSAPPMAEVLDPEPGAGDGAAAQAVETPDWKVPGNTDPQVGASSGSKGCGPRWAGLGVGGGCLRADLQ